MISMTHGIEIEVSKIKVNMSEINLDFKSKGENYYVSPIFLHSKLRICYTFTKIYYVRIYYGTGTEHSLFNRTQNKTYY